MSIFKNTAVVLFGIVLGVIITISSSTFAFKGLSNDERAEKFGVIMSVIMEETINEEGASDPDRLYNVAIQAVLEELGDKHGAYFTKEITEQVKADMQPANYGGIGTSIVEYKEGNVLGAMLLSPYDTSPATKAGLKSGDIITRVKVKGKWLNYKEGELGEFIKHLKGPKGTTVTVTVYRDGKKLPVVKIKRKLTKFQNVWVRVLSPGIVYARIVQFNVDVDKDLKKQILRKIKKLKKKKFRGIILDLRDNPGGRLYEAMRVSDLFIDKGKEVITVKSRTQGDVQYNAEKQPIVPENTPMVILINGGSASAAELVAGALVQQEVAISLGVKSYGKGSVQTIIDINDGSAIKVTTARYYPAGDLNVDGVGIEPTIKVEPEFDYLNESLSPEDKKKLYLKYYFARTSANPDKDVQLRRAVKEIVGW